MAEKIVNYTPEMTAEMISSPGSAATAFADADDFGPETAAQQGAMDFMSASP